MLTRLAIGITWLLHLLPLAVLNPMGQTLGILFFALGRSRRQVARKNLELCFPQWDEGQRERVLRAHFRAFGRAIVEASYAWWNAPERLRGIVRVEGQEHILALGDRSIILFVPHFVGLELAGLRMSTDFRITSMYSHQKNRVFDRFLRNRRQRFPGTEMVARPEGIKPIIRALRARKMVLLLPDMDLGPRESLFVPFLGVKAATVTVLPRLCRLTGAAVLPVVVTQLPGTGGYHLRIHPAWENYPTADDQADTRRMNAFIESRVREQPEQYLWTHKRFKTRPDGETSFYEP